MELEINPTGLLYKSQKNNNKIKMQIEIKDGLIKQNRSKPLSFFKPELGWMETNEPEDHLNKISNILKKSNFLENKLCFSYKDRSLAERLYSQQGKTDFLFSPLNGFVKSFPEEVKECELNKSISKIKKK